MFILIFFQLLSFSNTEPRHLELEKALKSKHSISIQNVNRYLEWAKDKSNQDTLRFKALFAAFKGAGANIAPELEFFLKDKEWMLRMAALQILGGIKDKAHLSKVLPLLKDRAQVVRSEALSTLEKLNPKDLKTYLKAIVNDQSNYHKGRPEWIVTKAKKILNSDF